MDKIEKYKKKKLFLLAVSILAASVFIIYLCSEPIVNGSHLVLLMVYLLVQIDYVALKTKIELLEEIDNKL